MKMLRAYIQILRMSIISKRKVLQKTEKDHKHILKAIIEHSHSALAVETQEQHLSKLFKRFKCRGNSFFSAYNVTNIVFAITILKCF